MTIPEIESRSIIERPPAPNGNAPIVPYASAEALIWFINSAQDEIAPWGSNVTLRDKQLRNFATMENVFLSALGLICSRNSAFSWVLNGPTSTVSRMHEVLENANFGLGWHDLMIKTSLDLYSQDNGAFWETVRIEDKPDSPVIGLNHLDAAKCRHTGAPEAPVIYYDRLGRAHLLKSWNVVTLAEMPAAFEHLYGVQYSVLTRLLRAVQILKNVNTYKYEKCRSSNDEMMLADGSWRKFGDLVNKQFEVFAFDDREKTFRRAKAYATDNGNKDCLKITTHLGRELIVTLGHPLYTFSGWTEAKDLLVGDKIGIPIELPVRGEETLTDDEVTFLAYIISDGGVSGGSVDFSQNPGSVLNDMRRIVESWGLKFKRDFGLIDYTITGPVGGRHNQNKALNLLREHGLWGHKSGTKFVPEAIMKSTPRQVALFLNRLLAGDGCISGPAIYHTSISARLSLDVWRLYMRLGIHAMRRRSFLKLSSTGEVWNTTIEDADNIRLFDSVIGAPLGKEKSMAALMHRVGKQTKRRTRHVDSFDKKYWDTLKGAIATSDKTYKEFGIGHIHGKALGQYNPTRTIAINVGNQLENCEISNLSMAPIGWDNIVSIESVPNVSTVALTVPGFETYVTETIEHNTGGRNTKSIVLVKGVTTKQMQEAIDQAKLTADAQGLTRYMNPIIAGSLDPKADVGFEVLELASLPEDYDEETTMKWYVAQVAMAFMEDYQTFAPLPGGNLGTSSQSDTLHMKSRGKGPALFMKLIAHTLNFRVFPKNIEIEWLEKDFEAQQAQALVGKTRAEERSIRIISGEITTEVAQQLANDAGDLSAPLLELMGQQDVTTDVRIDDESSPQAQLTTKEL